MSGFISEGWTVDVRYSALLNDGTIVATSEDVQGGVVQIVLGQDDASARALPRGLPSALLSARLSAGMTAELKVAADAAYGGVGTTTLRSPVPPHSDLVYRVEIVRAVPPRGEGEDEGAAGGAASTTAGGKRWADDAARHKEAGNSLLTRGDASGAVGAYRQASSCLRMAVRQGGAASVEALQPLHAAVHSNLSLAYLRLSKFAPALEAADAVLAQQGGHEKALFRRAKALEGLGRLDLASHALDALLAAKPGDASGLEYRAELDVKTGRAAPGVAPESESKRSDGRGVERVDDAQPSTHVPTLSPAPTVTATKPRAGDALAAGARKLFAPTAKGGAGGGLYADTPGYDRPLSSTQERSGEGGGWGEWATGTLASLASALTCGLCCARRSKAGKVE